MRSLSEVSLNARNVNSNRAHEGARGGSVCLDKERDAEKHATHSFGKATNSLFEQQLFALTERFGRN
ncbi:MAG: hypothetical protein KTR35_16050 [Gammaproteobacteria bacterium]|nr:hypothetical protein [Gammaproteobacteria bacterium]